MIAKSISDLTDPLPDSFDLSVLLERTTSLSPWADYCWNVLGVTAAPTDGADLQVPELVFRQGDLSRFRINGFSLRLHIDECESYYHNLVSPTPRCFVIADPDEGEGPVPVLVSLSFDEAHAYLEVEQEVFAVSIPPEIYRWAEGFVLMHYVPEKKTKRRLKNWHADGKPGPSAS